MTVASQKMGQAELSIRTSDGTTRAIVLDRSRYSVGRLASNQLSFQEVDGLSREHLAIERQGAQWTVRDLGSTNGTFLNGDRIVAPAILHSHDQITAGQLTLVFTSTVTSTSRDVVFVENSTDLDALTTTATLDGALAREAVGSDRYMRALIRAGRELAGRMRLENLFDLILNLSVDAVGASRGVLMILENEELQVRATRGAGFRISSGVRDLVLKEGRSLLVQDASKDRAFAARESIRQQQIRSILAVPLQTDERVIGLVYLDSPFLVHEFRNEDLSLLTVMANIAAIRIEHARLAQIEQAEKLRAREMEHAALIQRSILPVNFPAFPDRTEFELHAAMVSAAEVGGDLFDFFLLDNDHLGFVIGDVSGKGVPAALFMAVSRTLLRATAQHRKSPGECFAQVNATLLERNVASMFVTLFYGVLDLRSGQLEFANGGHNPAYVVAGSGKLRMLTAKSGPMLGLFAGQRYRTFTDRIEPGESVVLYTDGVTEARNKNGEFFGDERLQTFIADQGAKAAEKLIQGLHGTVQNFSAGTQQHDDFTVLALRYLA
jgi:sigma-B regulation protein RsbU (phosphoserine phosphatase)